MQILTKFLRKHGDQIHLWATKSLLKHHGLILSRTSTANKIQLRLTPTYNHKTTLIQ